MRRALTTTILFVLSSISLAAQEAHETHGTITAGYRFTNVKGREQKYMELFGLRDGFRLHDIDVYGVAAASNPYFDSYSLTATGIGGEPFSGGQFRLSKDRAFDLRLNYRQTYYYFDRNDSDLHPTGLQGLTSNHDWSTVRKFGSANFALYASNNLRFNFEYHRTSREGPAFTTRTLEYFGAPGTWAGFLRANPYVIVAPVDDGANRFTGGVSYSIRDWNIFYRAGYQRFTQDITMDNLAPGQRSINVGEAATATELLNDASWTEYRRLSTPVSEFSYNGQISPRVRLRGGYIFYRYAGPASLNAAFTGTSRTTSGVFAPYAVALNERADVKEWNHIIDQGFSIELNDRLNFHADYRYNRSTTDSHGRFESTQSATTRAEGETETEWEVGLHNLEVSLEYSPRRDLLVRPGIRLMKRDITMLDDGTLNPRASRPSKLASPILSVYYSPVTQFTLRGDIQNTTNDGPYTRISPRTDFAARLIARYQPIPQLAFENNLKLRDGEYTTTNFENSIRTNSTTIRYSPNDQFTAFGTFTYDSFLATASVTFIRGTAPLAATWRDQTINRIWQAGFEAKPVNRLTLTFSGNYDRTTGAGEISDEPPIFGPLRWPLVTGTVAYDFPAVGRLSIDLQRTYYIEEIMRGDNFSANLLGIRWTKEF